MKYISLFSGVEAASVAWGPLGWEPVAFCENDAFPSAVLAARFPEVPNLGDITKADWSDYAGKVDLVVGGSPCQSFSIAGTRTGLDGESGLMWEYVRCVREVRPRWFVWENVPGALSSAKGEDFRCLLSSMDELGYGLAWRVLDAQFFGVPQRRRRVFLVGSLGDRRAADVLFEPESLRWDSPSSRDKRQELASGTEKSAGNSSYGIRPEQTPTVSEDVQPTLRAHASGGFDDCVCTPKTWQIAGNIINRQPQHGGHQLGIRDPEIEGAFTLTTADRHAVVTPKTMVVRCGCSGGGKGALIQDDLCSTLAASNNPTLFQPVDGAPNVVCSDEVSYIVRKLTPRECERLQGFPDDWTLVDWKGKDAPDSKRYKAMGNSMAVPVMRWIGERIQMVENARKSTLQTLAELLEEDAEFFAETAEEGENVDPEEWAEILRERAEMARKADEEARHGQDEAS